MFKRVKSRLPKGFFWRLTLLNIMVIATTIAISGWAIYHTACFLVDGMGMVDDKGQRQFNKTLFQYLWVFSAVGIVAGSILHFYVTNKLLSPIRSLIHSTKQLQAGSYPEPIEDVSQDEIGELIEQYNALITQLQNNDTSRQKLVSDLSHEFRTPLANLNGYLHGLKTGVISGDQSLFEALYDQTKRLTLMLEQLEQLKEWDYVSSQTISEKQFIQISEEVEQCISMFEWTLHEKAIELTFDVKRARLKVHREGFQQVLTNLIDNAIRYYEGVGPIIVRGKTLVDDGYQLSVTGPGASIPPGEDEHVFERFYRIDESRSRQTGGSGLGLAIAKEIVERHDGEIGFERKNENNMFWFTLPFE